MKRISIYIVFFLFLSNSMYSKRMKEGSYRAILYLHEEKGIELPFIFTFQYEGKKPIITIYNADEQIRVDEIRIKGDSVNFKMPFFDTEFMCKQVGNDLEGYWINHYKLSNSRIRFTAKYGEAKRFISIPAKPDPVFEGNWEVTFSPESKDSSKAIGVFHHHEQSDYISGTFLTETGDYRFLDGIKEGHTLRLSCFDGSHAFLFTAEYVNGLIQNGKFYSGSTWEENWIARRNPDFKLADPEEISFVKNKDIPLRFSFPNLEGTMCSLQDEKYKNKAVIIQLMGSWCPNCMDESVYLTNIYDQYRSQGLEIIALAFEKTNDFEKAKSQVMRLKKKLNIEYDILLTQQIGKDKAGEALMLNKVTAFPTTLFLNRSHQVVKIHTGFSGPATGNEYELFKRRTENSIKTLLKD